MLDKSIPSYVSYRITIRGQLDNVTGAKWSLFVADLNIIPASEETRRPLHKLQLKCAAIQHHPGRS